MSRQLLIDNVPIPRRSALRIDQDYTVLHAADVSRTADGTAQVRTLWSGKLATTITAQGLMPPGLAALTGPTVMTLGCIQHRALTATGRVFTLPAARRTDAGSTPYGRALVGDRWVAAAVESLAANVLTLAAVAGASQYQAVWFPSISAVVQPPTERLSSDGLPFGWELTAEQV